MIATRPECGTGYGIRYHLAKDEPFCDLCTDHVMDRRLVRETRTLTGSTTAQERTLRQAIHALAQMLDEHDTTKRTQPAPAPVASITTQRPRPATTASTTTGPALAAASSARSRPAAQTRTCAATASTSSETRHDCPCPDEAATAHDPRACAVDQRQRPRPLDQEGPPDSLVAVRVGRGARHQKLRPVTQPVVIVATVVKTNSPLRRREPCPNREGRDRWAQGFRGAA